MITLRSALFNLVFFAVTFVLTVLGAIVHIVAPRRALDVSMLWGRIMVATARTVCRIRLEVSGWEHIPQGAALIASRHQSAFDTFVWLTLVPRCCYVVKHELLRIPLFGALITASGMIVVDRRAGAAALRSLVQEGERAVRERRQIVIFPEGTRGAPGVLGDLQPGIAALAARTGLAVIPVATDSGRCWGRRAFRKRPGTIRIKIGEPIAADLGRQALMRALRAGLGGLEHERPEADQTVT